MHWKADWDDLTYLQPISLFFFLPGRRIVYEIMFPIAVAGRILIRRVVCPLEKEQGWCRSQSFNCIGSFPHSQKFRRKKDSGRGHVQVCCEYAEQLCTLVFCEVLYFWSVCTCINTESTPVIQTQTKHFFSKILIKEATILVLPCISEERGDLAGMKTQLIHCVVQGCPISEYGVC